MLEIQAGHVLRNFFLRDVALARLENLHHFIYAIIIGLTRFGTDDPWPHSSCVGGQQKVASLSRHQSRVRIDYAGNVIARLIQFPFQNHLHLLPK